MGTGLTRLRASTRRDGAEQSGLSALLELSVINAVGDALVTVVLAGSLFFSVPTGEARSKVALYLLITMVPFVLLAPVIGPVLDRFPYGRRTALAALCLGRGMLAWQLASSLTGLAVYPLALGLLMLSRAFGVARSAVTPRVAPPEQTLVKVNSRMSMFNIAAGSLAAPIGLGIANIPYVGYSWVLRLCAVVFLAGVPFAFRLPKRVDSNEGERRLREVVASATGPHAPIVVGQTRAGRPARARAVFSAVLGASPAALRSTLVLRSIVGFLTFYLAFLLRAEGGTSLWLGVLAAAVAVGSGLGVVIGGRLGRRRPERILTLALLLTTGGSALAAVVYAKLPALLAALLAFLAGSMAKLALDAIIQRDTADDVRNSAFARSETVLQLGWVAGGAIGLIEMPGRLGFALAAVAAGVTVFGQARELRRIRVARRAAADAGTGPTDAWPDAGPTAWSPARGEILPAMMPAPGNAAGWAADYWSSDAGAALDEDATVPARRRRRGLRARTREAELTRNREAALDADATRPLDGERRHPQVPPPR
jgi:MFS family permease